MIEKDQTYNPPAQYLFLDEKKLGITKKIRKQIQKFELTCEVRGLASQFSNKNRTLHLSKPLKRQY
jgi:hypothetical protein